MVVGSYFAPPVKSYQQIDNGLDKSLEAVFLKQQAFGLSMIIRRSLIGSGCWVWLQMSSLKRDLCL